MADAEGNGAGRRMAAGARAPAPAPAPAPAGPAANARWFAYGAGMDTAFGGVEGAVRVGVGFIPNFKVAFTDLPVDAAGGDTKEPNTAVASIRRARDDQVFGAIWEVPEEAGEPDGSGATPLMRMAPIIVKSELPKIELQGSALRRLHSCFAVVRTVVIAKGSTKGAPCLTYTASSGTRNDSDALPSREYRLRLCAAASRLALPGLYRASLESFPSRELKVKIDQVLEDETGAKSGKSREEIHYVRVSLASACDSAAARALEVVRPDPLYLDPLACIAAGPPAIQRAIKTLPMSDGPRGREYHMRIRYVDDFVRSSIGILEDGKNDHGNGEGQDHIKQLVVLGAGFDATAVRLGPHLRKLGVKVFELDLKPIILIKKLFLLDVLSDMELGHITYVPADLRSGDWIQELKRHGLNPLQRTAWICQSLFPYLSEETVKNILQGIHTFSSGSNALVLATVVRKNNLNMNHGGNVARIKIEALRNRMQGKSGLTEGKRDADGEQLQTALESLLEEESEKGNLETPQKFWECANTVPYFKSLSWKVVHQGTQQNCRYPDGIYGYFGSSAQGTDNNKRKDYSHLSSSLPPKIPPKTFCVVLSNCEE